MIAKSMRCDALIWTRFSRAVSVLLLTGALLFLWAAGAHAGQRSYQVVAINQSPDILAVSGFSLQKGEWSVAPVQSQTVVRGKPVAWSASMVSTVEGAEMEGVIVLTPVSGGRLSVSFSWKEGEDPVGEAVCEGCRGLRAWTSLREGTSLTILHVNVGGM